MKIKKFQNRSAWLKARKIGSTDLNAIVNKTSRWGNINEVYERLVGETANERVDSVKMANGRYLEEHIKQIFLINHPELKRQYADTKYLLVISDEYSEITLSPDTLVKNGFVEIKNKDFYSDNIGEYLGNLKEQEPQYYWQMIHYFVVLDKAQFGYLVVAFNINKKDLLTNEWKYDRTVIDSLKIEREAVKSDIELAKSKLKDFIENNLRKHIHPLLEQEDMAVWKAWLN